MIDAYVVYDIYPLSNKSVVLWVYTHNDSAATQSYPFEYQGRFVYDATHHRVTSTMRLCRITIISAAVLQWYQDDLRSLQHAAA